MRVRLALPTKRGARLGVTRRMSREATQKLGCWKAPEVMEGVYSKARSEEIAPEIQAAFGRARDTGVTWRKIPPVAEKDSTSGRVG